MSEPAVGDLHAHILEAATQAINFAEGMSKEGFLADKRTQQAIILNLVIIGEAATKLMDRYPETAALRLDVEWKAMRGMRNRIAHGYYDINLDVVWDTVATSLPDLVACLENFDR
jgi:uncharacterized protein with HEPN domain